MDAQACRQEFRLRDCSAACGRSFPSSIRTEPRGRVVVENSSQGTSIPSGRRGGTEQHSETPLVGGNRSGQAQFGLGQGGGDDAVDAFARFLDQGRFRPAPEELTEGGPKDLGVSSVMIRISHTPITYESEGGVLHGKLRRASRQTAAYRESWDETGNRGDERGSHRLSAESRYGASMVGIKVRRPSMNSATT